MVRTLVSQARNVEFESHIRQFCVKHTSYACKPCYASLDSVSQNTFSLRSNCRLLCNR